MQNDSLSILEKHDQKNLENFFSSVNGDTYKILAKNYIQTMFSEDFRKPTFIVCNNNKKIIGAAAFSEEFFTVNTWGISWVSVDKHHRNKGLGQKLVKACLDEISKRIQTPSTVILLTYPNKTSLYEKLGFRGQTQDCDGGLFLSLSISPKGTKI